MHGLEARAVKDPDHFKTPALQAAAKQGRGFWAKTLTFPPIAVPPEIEATLNAEVKSVGHLFRIVAQFALDKESDYTRVDGSGYRFRIEVTGPGGRRWAQRTLAASAGMAVNTVRAALERLQQLGLIWFEAVEGLCTYVFVKGLKKLVRSRWWRQVVDNESAAKKLKTEPEEVGSRTGVSKTDTFPPRPNVLYRSTNTVDGSRPASTDKKEGVTLEKPRVRELVSEFLANQPKPPPLRR